VLVLVVDIGGVVDHHCLNFLLVIYLISVYSVNLKKPQEKITPNTKVTN